MTDEFDELYYASRTGVPMEMSDVDPWWTSRVSRAECTREHRHPQGPNEDLGTCPDCWGHTFTLRPEGETFGYHYPDCSLPERHESFCQSGGSGHEPAPRIRGVAEERLREEDLRIEVYRSGAVVFNPALPRPDSVVRIIHLPTGLSATSDTERTQLENKARCLHLLRAKLWWHPSGGPYV